MVLCIQLVSGLAKETASCLLLLNLSARGVHCSQPKLLHRYNDACCSRWSSVRFRSMPQR